MDTNQIQIVRGPMVALQEYERVSIAYEITGRASTEALFAGRIVVLPEPTRWKDYDSHPEERPSRYQDRFDTRNWTVITTRLANERVGGAIVACQTPEFNQLEGRSDLAIIIDIRVSQHHRGEGIGRALVQEAEAWARERGCTEIIVETQDVNVDACRFYLACGFHLKSADPHGYGPDLDEACLIWSKAL